MNSNMHTALANHIKITFGNALDKVVDRIAEMLETAAQENRNDDNQISSAQMTINPKIRIQFTTPGEFMIDVIVPAKRIEKVCGEAEAQLSLDVDGNEVPDLEQELPGMPEE